MHFIAAIIAVHCFYLAKAKGYPLKLVTAGGVLCWLLAFLFGVPGLIPIGILWLVLVMSKPRPGAPGKAYLVIKMDCPECKKPVSFPRHLEGRAQLCPACGELIRLPLDGQEHQPPPTDKPLDNEGGTFGGMKF